MMIRRMVPLMAALVVATGLAVGAASSAPAATSAQSSSSQYPVNSCKFYHDHEGPWGVIRSYSKRWLAWTANGTNIGNWIAIRTYADHLNQCWKELGGFGNGEAEFTLAHTGMCVSVAGASKSAGAHVALYPCLSKSRELWKIFVNGTKLMFQNVNSKLCIHPGEQRPRGRALRRSGEVQHLRGLADLDAYQPVTSKAGPGL